MTNLQPYLSLTIIVLAVLVCHNRNGYHPSHLQAISILPYNNNVQQQNHQPIIVKCGIFLIKRLYTSYDKSTAI